MLNLGVYLELAEDYETVTAVRLAMGSLGTGHLPGTGHRGES